MSNEQPFVQRPTTLWIAIASAIVTATVAFTTLSNKVEAMYDKGVKLREEYEETDNLLIEVRESQIRMEKDIEFIRDAIIVVEE